MKLPKGTVVLDVGNGVRGTLRDDAEIDIEGVDNHDDLAAALVAGGRTDLLPELAHTTDEGVDVQFSQIGVRIETPAAETVESAAIDAQNDFVPGVSNADAVPIESVFTPSGGVDSLGEPFGVSEPLIDPNNQVDDAVETVDAPVEIDAPVDEPPAITIPIVDEVPVSNDLVSGAPGLKEWARSSDVVPVVDPVIDTPVSTNAPVEAEVVPETETISAPFVAESPAEPTAADGVDFQAEKRAEVREDLAELGRDLEDLGIGEN